MVLVTIDLKEIIGISVIIPTKNEEYYIERCINSLLNCRSIDSDSFDVQFIIVDGMSTDKTVGILKEKFDHLNIKILKNSNLYQSFAMNLGVNISKSSIIIRADAHSVYPKDYIFQCWQALIKSGAGNAGSIQKAVGTNKTCRFFEDIISEKTIAS